MRPVDADEVVRLMKLQIEPLKQSVSWQFSNGYTLAMHDVEHAPTLDVAPVVHAHWVIKHVHRGGMHRYTGFDDFGEEYTITVDERVEYDDRYCSRCGKQSSENFLNYCAHCGAKMDEPEDMEDIQKYAQE